MSITLNEIKKIVEPNLRFILPKFKVGDTLKVELKIKEGEKERLQSFEGILIADKGAGISRMITLRKISYSEGVERIFPLYSPSIERIEIVQKGKVRRAKLYYLRDLKKKIRLNEKIER